MAEQSLSGKLVSETKIQSNGDMFHEIIREKPHLVSQMTPAHVRSCDLHEGAWGKVGSMISWVYVHEGRKKVAKEIVEEIDVAKKVVKFNVVEADLLEFYNKFYITVHVDKNIVTWILEYEKKNSNVPDPHTVMELFVSMTKDIDTSHLK